MNSSRPAYSLVFAFLIMTVMMIVAGTAIQNTNKKLQLYNDLGSSSQAYLAAVSAAEKGVLAMSGFGPGYETNENEAYCEGADSDGSCDSWGNFTILAKEREYNGYFYTPIFGTGTAGNSDDCSVLDYIDPDDGEVIDSLSIDVDNPCHWNKLLYGESVTIPLFDTDSSGNPVLPVSLAGFSGWELRVRTPCSDGTMVSDCMRYELDTSTASNPDDVTSGEGDTVVFWQLVGEDSAGNEVGLIPNDDPGEDEFFNESRDANPSNTEIYESLINDESSDEFTVLSPGTGSRYDALLNFSQGDLNNDGAVESVLSSLYVQLNIVTPLLSSSGASIPYLEWQLIWDAAEPVADTKSVMIGEGFFQGLSNLYYNSYLISRSTTGESTNVYTLSN